mgnify:CR=1 FL=1
MSPEEILQTARREFEQEQFRAASEAEIGRQQTFHAQIMSIAA